MNQMDKKIRVNSVDIETQIEIFIISRDIVYVPCGYGPVVGVTIDLLLKEINGSKLLPTIIFYNVEKIVEII